MNFVGFVVHVSLKAAVGSFITYNRRCYSLHYWDKEYLKSTILFMAGFVIFNGWNVVTADWGLYVTTVGTVVACIGLIGMGKAIYHESKE